MTKSAAFIIYVVVDVSFSMSGPPVHALNDALKRLAEDIQRDPVSAELVWISIISFADDARVELPLTRGSKITQLPVLKERGGTLYKPAIDALVNFLSADIAALKDIGLRVYRPIAFFFTDGEPQDMGYDLDQSVIRLRSAMVTAYAIGLELVSPDALVYLTSDPKNLLLARSGASSIEVIQAYGELISSAISSTGASIKSASFDHVVSIPDALTTLPPDFI